jgi:hypothetical protein
MNSDSTISLTHSQRALLADAAERHDGACGLPSRTNWRPVPKYLASLIEQRLLREVRAKADMPAWRDDDNGRPLALIITKRGRDAARVAAEQASEPHDEGSRPDPKESVNAARQPRDGSKIATVIMLLRRETGVSLADLVAATGWLPHTTRAALTGLRKRGHQVTRLRQYEGGSIYRIVNVPDQAVAA